MSVLDLSYNFAALSLQDLLAARDTYHWHLLGKPNVVGTAVGLYLIRKDEKWPKDKHKGQARAGDAKGARTLANSEVRPYSWPCVLVFVRDWAAEDEFGTKGRFQPSQIVPKTLFMSDGRAVPVCVVETPELPQPSESAIAQPVARPSHQFGGGLPITVEVQGATHLATAGCLVTDGHLTYALTARHACGEAGTEVFSTLRSGRTRVGVSSPLQLSRLPVADVYPEFPGQRTYVSLDVGLVRIDDVNEWTSNTYALPPAGPLADVHEHNLSMQLIDQPVVGFGAVSGLLGGHIKALFYRHRSIGGFDYMGDFLIACDSGRPTVPGDSGMVWHLDVTPTDDRDKSLSKHALRPLAVEWGGQVFDAAGRRSTFAVATSLSSVCRLLDVELVTDASRGVSGYWGRTGHYSIAAFAIGCVKDKTLKAFLEANAENISFDLQAISAKDFDKSVGQLTAADEFVPLADVPDEIWKKLPTGKNGRTGGRDTRPGGHGSDGPEHPNHYADVDAPYQGTTWRQACLADDSKISVQAWLDYYEQMAQQAENAGDKDSATQYRTAFKQGLLPFRVWQFFDAMVEKLENKDITGFLCAAGTLAHYVGDASQPLHGSIYADGDPSRTAERHHPQSGETETVRYGEGVHSAYETAMVSRYAAELLKKIGTKLGNKAHGLPLVASGKEAARATLELMDKAAKTLPPITIVEEYEAAGAGTRVATLEALWDAFSTETTDVLAFGAQYLAMIWDSAWKAGNGAAIDGDELKELKPSALRKLYTKNTFVPSLTLKDIEAVLR